MKPLDPRLLRHARSARRYVALTASTGVLTALLVVAQAWLISRIISPVVLGTAHPGGLSRLIAALAAVAGARALVTLLQESRAHKAATATIIELRRQVLKHSVALGPRWQALHGPETTTLLTRGLDDLEPYFTRYLPQLLLAATVTPLTGMVMLTSDIPSTIAVALTVPLIPVFMILIGRLTQESSRRRLAAMERLGGQVLDLLAGLPTLKALGREAGPARRVAELGDAYNRTTMATLRVAFLSGAVLEFLTTLSVAIIAVEVGFRLLFGSLDLATALLVIMIAPEVYQPLRQFGFHFHASANGVAAANEVFEILASEAPASGRLPAPDLSGSTIRFSHVSVAARGTWAPADLDGVIAPGRIVALAGPSGAGKTTSSQVLLGLLRPDRGRVTVQPPSSDALDLTDVDLSTWWAQIAWVPQRPVLLPGTVLSNATGSPDTEVTASLKAAARATGLEEVVGALDQGWHTPIGQGGSGLSVGQRQRLALTRALVGHEPLVVLDEPTAHLDAASEAHVLDAVAALKAAGRTVVVVAHRAALLALADDVITVSTAPADELKEVHE